MLAFSTCWNNARHTEGEAMIDEILELGFNNIELSHGMTISKYPGIKRAFQQKKFVCSGVHNYFPAPLEVLIDAPDAFEFTSNRRYERNKAMRLAKQSLETAAEFQAGYLVMHLGSTPMRRDRWTHRLTKWAGERKTETKEFIKFREKFIHKRDKYSKRYFSRSLEALEILADFAKQAGVPLAIESRSHFEDIPHEKEMRQLQEHFKKNPWIGYWHDFGHVQLKHNLGLLDHQKWLEEMSPHLLGCHLHDVQYPAKDHRVPFDGELDYRQLLASIDPDAPLVWEINHTQTQQQISNSLNQWKQHFPEYL